VHPTVIPIGEAIAGSFATVAGVIESVRIDPRDDRLLAFVRDGTGELRVTWSGAAWRRPVLPGRGIILRGRVRASYPREMFNPRFVLDSE